MNPLFERRLREIQRKEEARLARIEKRADKPAGLVQTNMDKLEAKIPQGAKATLEKAFSGGMRILLNQGMGVLDKIVGSEKQRRQARENRSAVLQVPTRASLRIIRKQASSIHFTSLGLTTAEGAALGLLGIGLPDIPVFMGALLGSCFAMAQSYGWDYKRPEEQTFALQVIQGAVCGGKEYSRVNASVDRTLYAMSMMKPYCYDLQGAVNSAAAALASDLLLLKTVQGFPLVGIVGGVGNAIYCQKVLDYAAVKYEKRFLLEHMHC